MRAALLLLGLSLPLLAAQSDPAQSDSSKSDLLAGRIAGKPQRCLPLSQSQVQGPTITDDGVILYRQGAGRRIWRANLRGPCPNLRPFNTIISEVYAGQYCRNDRFRVLEPNLSIPGPYCRFESFTPYDRPEEPSSSPRP